MTDQTKTAEQEIARLNLQVELLKAALKAYGKHAALPGDCPICKIIREVEAT